MASQGPNSPGALSGTWANTTNAASSNNSYSSNSSVSGSNELIAYNFGFTIPAGSTINGIKIEIEKKQSTVFSSIYDIGLYIRKSDATYGATNKADTLTVWPLADTYTIYGGSTDLWNESWSVSDINDSDFGLKFLANAAGFFKTKSTPQVDHIRITVYYTEGGSSAAVKTIGGIAVANIKSIIGVLIGNVKTYFGITK